MSEIIKHNQVDEIGSDTEPETMDALLSSNEDSVDATLGAEELGHDSMARVMSMFGTDAARNRFLSLAEKYYTAFRYQKYSSLTGVIAEMEKERASLHNAIMETVQRLSLSPHLNASQQKLLAFLAKREKVTDMIADYFATVPPRVSKIAQMRQGYFDSTPPTH